MNTEHEFDPEALDKALDRVIETASAARDAFIMGDLGVGELKILASAEALKKAQEIIKRIIKNHGI